MTTKDIADLIGVDTGTVATAARRIGLKINHSDISDDHFAALLRKFAEPHHKRDKSITDKAAQYLANFEAFRDNEGQGQPASDDNDIEELVTQDEEQPTDDKEQATAIEIERLLAEQSVHGAMIANQSQAISEIKQAVLAMSTKPDPKPRNIRVAKFVAPVPAQQPHPAPVPIPAPDDAPQGEQRPSAKRKVFLAVFVCILLWQMVHTGYLEYSISKFQGGLGVMMAAIFAVGVQFTVLLLTLNYGSKKLLVIGAINDVAVNLLCYFPNPKLAIVLLSIVGGLTIFSFSELFVRNVDDNKKTTGDSQGLKRA